MLDSAVELLCVLHKVLCLYHSILRFHIDEDERLLCATSAEITPNDTAKSYISSDLDAAPIGIYCLNIWINFVFKILTAVCC